VSFNVPSSGVSGRAEAVIFQGEVGECEGVERGFGVILGIGMMIVMWKST
jgi:hypothetical protein